MNQMMGSAATSLSSMFNRKIDISPPIANLVETYNELDDNLPGFLKNHFVMVAFKMQIGELIDSEIMQLYPKEFAQELLNMFMPSAEPEQPQVSQEDTANHQEEQLQQAPAQNMTQTMPQQDVPVQNTTAQTAPQQGMPMQNMGMPYGYGMPMQGMPMQGMPMAGYAPAQDVNVSPAAFQPFSTDVNPLTQKENIELIRMIFVNNLFLNRRKFMAKNILICDDAAFMRMMIKDILTKNGYNIAGEAENGQKAVEKYAELKPDLVLMDITMPEMDGIEALKRIKAADPSASVIMCSAMGQQAMVIESIQSGAKDFIVKPFQADRVIEAVQKVVG